MTPVVKERPGSWVFTWEYETPIVMRVERVKRHTSGMLSADLWVTSGSDPLSRNGHLHHSSLSNLLGPRVRGDVVRALNDRMPDVAWADLLETTLEYVIERVQQGEPVLLLADVPTTEESKWLLSPVIQENQPTVLFGYGGQLKSYIAHYWAIRVALGEDAKPGNVLILDWESTADEWSERQNMICEGLGRGQPPNLYYRHCSQPFATEIDEIQKEAGEYEADLVVIDSAAYACGDEPEKAGPTMDFFRALRALRCSALVIAHQNSDSKSRKPFGSLFWENSARSTIQVRKADEPSGRVSIGLWNRKVNRGRGFQPFALNAEFHIFDESHYSQGDYVRFSQGLLADIPDLGQDGSATDRVLVLLRELERAQSPSQIGDALRMNPSTVRSALKRLGEREEIAMAGGLYQATG
jgi:hypothetical protein